MLNFNSSGLLVPNRNIQVSLDEFRQVFVEQLDSEERRTHFAAYVRYSEDLKNVCGGVGLTQWINGSFVTRTGRPKDIDMVTFIDHTKPLWTTSP